METPSQPESPLPELELELERNQAMLFYLFNWLDDILRIQQK
jgi:hypothetical protein